MPRNRIARDMAPLLALAERDASKPTTKPARKRSRSKPAKSGKKSKRR